MRIMLLRQRHTNNLKSFSWLRFIGENKKTWFLRFLYCCIMVCSILHLWGCVGTKVILLKQAVVSRPAGWSRACPACGFMLLTGLKHTWSPGAIQYSTAAPCERRWCNHGILLTTVTCVDRTEILSVQNSQFDSWTRLKQSSLNDSEWPWMRVKRTTTL